MCGIFNLYTLYRMSAAEKWQAEKEARLAAVAEAEAQGDMEEVRKIHDNIQRYELLVGKYGHEAASKGVEEAMWQSDHKTPEDAWAAADAEAAAAVARAAAEAAKEKAKREGVWAYSPPRMPRSWAAAGRGAWLGAESDGRVPTVYGAPSPRPLAAREEELAMRVEVLRHAAVAAKANHEAAARQVEQAIILGHNRAEQMALEQFRATGEAAAAAHAAFSDAQRAAEAARPPAPRGRGGYRRSRRSRKNKRTRNTRRRIR